MPKGVYPRTLENCKNISIGKKGKPTWNKGKCLVDIDSKKKTMNLF